MRCWWPTGDLKDTTVNVGLYLFMTFLWPLFYLLWQFSHTWATLSNLYVRSSFLRCAYTLNLSLEVIRSTLQRLISLICIFIFCVFVFFFTNLCRSNEPSIFLYLTRSVWDAPPWPKLCEKQDDSFVSQQMHFGEWWLLVALTPHLHTLFLTWRVSRIPEL